jgi:hypothetical protein
MKKEWNERNTARAAAAHVCSMACGLCGGVVLVGMAGIWLAMAVG